MKKAIYISLLFYYLAGQLFLPFGNFAYLQQLPKLYHDFEKINGHSGVIDFVSEQFFDYDGIFGLDSPQQNPADKDDQPVPFHAVTVAPLSAIVTPPQTEKIILKETPVIINTEYILKKSFTIPRSIFHPPSDCAMPLA